jgi:hypothetical protein
METQTHDKILKRYTTIEKIIKKVLKNKNINENERQKQSEMLSCQLSVVVRLSLFSSAHFLPSL